MKIKTSEATPLQLNWLVAKIEGLQPLHHCTYDRLVYVICELDHGMGTYSPTTDWSQGGPIIEREGITVGDAGGSWVAGKPWADDFFSEYVVYGPTPLIAAMRCFVASKLGDEVDVPDELLGEEM